MSKNNHCVGSDCRLSLQVRKIYEDQPQTLDRASKMGLWQLSLWLAQLHEKLDLAGAIFKTISPAYKSRQHEQGAEKRQSAKTSDAAP